MKLRKYRRPRRKPKKSSHPRFTLEGKEFGAVKVIRFSHCLNRRSYWYCKCFCGNIFIKCRKILTEKKRNKNISCGCIPRISAGNFEWGERTETEKIQYKMDAITNLSHKEKECRIWDGYCHRGIPKCSYLNKVYSVRRLLWILLKKEGLTRNMGVIQTCGNLRCIEEKHLTLIKMGKNGNKKNN